MTENPCWHLDENGNSVYGVQGAIAETPNPPETPETPEEGLLPIAPPA